MWRNWVHSYSRLPMETVGVHRMAMIKVSRLITAIIN